MDITEISGILFRIGFLVHAVAAVAAARTAAAAAGSATVALAAGKIAVNASYTETEKHNNNGKYYPSSDITCHHNKSLLKMQI
ncbi:hypothetical protein [uncultured Megamonas sp.]|uniref:hypothetical protein n=1 Tax=uncultured Megamonas sp. TaxID=286140 RepID=UPI00259B1F3A|nr:hypothetical protein [uncultured Megamonas sp.]